MKHIFVTGGVVSKLGKGLKAASLGALLVARLAMAAADAPAAGNTAGPTTAVPVVGVFLLPTGEIFKSWAEYQYTLRLESEEPEGRAYFQGVKVTALDIVVRRADTGRAVARISYLGSFHNNLNDARPDRDKVTNTRDYGFSSEQVKALEQNPPGAYLVAVNINGVRASNVVQIRIDPKYDAAKTPVLQLGGMEPGPRSPHGVAYLFITGPQPADPILQTRFLRYSLTTDGVTKRYDLGAGSGPSGRAIPSGESARYFLSGNPWSNQGVLGTNPASEPDWGQPHTFTVIISGTAQFGLSGEPNPSATQSSHYEAGPFVFDPRVHPLGDAWDRISQKEPPTP